jgi:dTDP-4-amino-4,6-dideoxygalactose transaminase
MIPFNKPALTGNEAKYVQQALTNAKLCGDGEYGKKCETWFNEQLSCKKTLLTPSCTAALELAALLIDIRPGDEVIMPSYTFVSTANPFVLRGASIVFVDIRKDTMNIDETLIEAAITSKTKAIVPVHYAGVSCEMDVIMDVAERHGLFVIEDAAQGVMAEYKGRALGTIGHLGAYSFHETKNLTSGGEGGLLIINDERFNQRAEIIREKGTNRSQFIRGHVDKYTWVDIGSSYLPSELQAAFLWGQLKRSEFITRNRLDTWNDYNNSLKHLEDQGRIELPVIPKKCQFNAHMFFLKLKSQSDRSKLINHLNELGVATAFHYVPLHRSKAGLTYGRFHGHDTNTTAESEKLLRMPLWYGIDKVTIRYIIKNTVNFFK